MSYIENLFPLTKLTPGAAMSINRDQSNRGLIGMPRRLLLIGQVANDAQIETGKIKTISTLQTAEQFLGRGSMLMAMWMAASPNTIMGLPIDVIALHDAPSAIKATGSIIINADNVQGGRLALYVAGTSVAVGVAKGATTEDIATSLITALTMQGDDLPVTAVKSGADTINFTCKWAGETGNDIDIRINYHNSDVTPKGITTAITDMNGGTLNPDLTPVVMGMKNHRETEIVSPYADAVSMNLLEEELERRWGFQSMKDGQMVVAKNGSEGEILAWLEERNSIQAHSKHDTKPMTTPWETAAMAGAGIESSASIDSAVPHFANKMIGYQGSRPEDAFEETEENNILLAGGSPTINQNGDGYLGRMVTNMTKSKTGQDDDSWRNLTHVKLMSYWRWYCVNRWVIEVLELGFKMGAYITDPIPGQRIVYSGFPTEFMLKCYDVFINAGLFQGRDKYKETLLEELDAEHNKVKVSEKPIILTGLYQIEATANFRVI